jgi:16S rRNA (guanine527-N7)-methyltransferase
LTKYYQLLCSWNSRLHLVAPTSPGEFAKRHILESLLVLKYLPGEARVADIGSGGGLPIIPCLIARPDIQATLIESSKKKAVFLREALNQMRNSHATVIPERFESVAAPEVDFITCRALERFQEVLTGLIDWAPPTATLLLFGGPGLRKSLEDLGLDFDEDLIPSSERRFLFRVNRRHL